MTPEQVQEEISKAYLHAVAAECGFAVGSWTQDHGCVDATVGAASTVGGGRLARPKVDIQLKATRRQDLVREKFVSWTLEVDHYDSLRQPASIPHLLVLLLLPRDASTTVQHTVDYLLIRGCAYWLNMTGMPPAQPRAKSKFAKSKTIRLPKSQTFSPQALTDILTRISQGCVP
ncbi:MAG: DUF4365 domain-containing protein [Deltaproteobacteria bacterium]|nr:DUF4365 domain-containing protein [Deltaproteobacteria bacterium]